jgi:hypothetical protein
MKFRYLIAAVASIGLMATPTLAAGAPAEVAPATETVEGQQLQGASVLLQVTILIAIIAAIYFGAKALDKDEPASP